MKLSARNQLGGTIKRVVRGAVNAEVTLEIGNGVDVVAVITSESVERLSLEVGKRAYAIVKASDVLIATD
jgi:molybdopterin-binding protein